MKGGDPMLKTDALDEVMDLLIRRVLDDEREAKEGRMKLSLGADGGDGENGVYPTAGLGKQA